jgi:hypothetical protein
VSVSNRRDPIAFAAAATELAGDGGFGLLENSLQAGLQWFRIGLAQRSQRFTKVHEVLEVFS